MPAMELTARRLWWMIAFGGFIFTLQISETASQPSVDTVPTLWPYDDGNVRISCPKFQKSVFLGKPIKYVLWHRCIDHCNSTDGQHDWAPLAKLMYKSGAILMVNGGDASIYHLNEKGILTIRGQTVADNGTEYRCDVRFPHDLESDHILLVHYDEGKEAEKVATNEKNCYPVPQNDSSYENGSASGPGINNTSSGNKDTDNTCPCTEWKIVFAMVCALLSFLGVLAFVVWKYRPCCPSDQPIQGQEVDDVPMLKL